MCDASEHATGNVLLIEDYTESDTGAMKSYATAALTTIHRRPNVVDNVRQGVSGDAFCL